MTLSIQSGLIVMVAGFVAVWLTFVIYGEVAIARDRRLGLDDGQDGADTHA